MNLFSYFEYEIKLLNFTHFNNKVNFKIYLKVPCVITQHLKLILMRFASCFNPNAHYITYMYSGEFDDNSDYS